MKTFEDYRRRQRAELGEEQRGVVEQEKKEKQGHREGHREARSWPAGQYVQAGQRTEEWKGRRRDKTSAKRRCGTKEGHGAGRKLLHTNHPITGHWEERPRAATSPALVMAKVRLLCS